MPSEGWTLASAVSGAGLQQWDASCAWSEIEGFVEGAQHRGTEGLCKDRDHLRASDLGCTCCHLGLAGLVLDRSHCVPSLRRGHQKVTPRGQRFVAAFFLISAAPVLSVWQVSHKIS